MNDEPVFTIKEIKEAWDRADKSRKAPSQFPTPEPMAYEDLHDELMAE